MSCNPHVAHVHKAHTPCNVHQKLANRLDNRGLNNKNLRDRCRLWHGLHSGREEELLLR